MVCFFFSSRRRHTRCGRDWSSDVCSSDLALAAAVLGGLDSPVGAVVGGLMLGVGLNLIGTYVDFVGNELKLPFALVLIAAVLLVKPTGLFGRATVRRV